MTIASMMFDLICVGVYFLVVCAMAVCAILKLISGRWPWQRR